MASTLFTVFNIVVLWLFTIAKLLFTSSKHFFSGSKRHGVVYQFNCLRFLRSTLRWGSTARTENRLSNQYVCTKESFESVQECLENQHLSSIHQFSSFPGQTLFFHSRRRFSHFPSPFQLPYTYTSFHISIMSHPLDPLRSVPSLSSIKCWKNYSLK